MADLKARRVLGGRHTASDTIELQFTYTGDAHSCDQYIEVISGSTVTHGGGATAATPLHYKSTATDADSDGVIDYATSQMPITQSARGTTVVKVVADILLKADYDNWKTAQDTWVDAYFTSEDGADPVTIADGAPSSPTYPTATTYRSGEISLEWADDTFV